MRYARVESKRSILEFWNSHIAGSQISLHRTLLTIFCMVSSVSTWRSYACDLLEDGTKWTSIWRAENVYGSGVDKTDVWLAAATFLHTVHAVASRVRRNARTPVSWYKLLHMKIPLAVCKAECNHTSKEPTAQPWHAVDALRNRYENLLQKNMVRMRQERDTAVPTTDHKIQK